MSGIVASYSRIGGVASREEIEAMIAAIAYRGPDRRGVWAEGPAALGHCALHTTREALHEKLPFRHEESGVAIVCDGRIDNRDELLSQLDLRGGPASEVGDSTLILHAYLKWGLESPRHLLGDFAIALWDQRRNRIVLARDIMGIKPLYYYANAERAYVASELRGLLASGEVPCVVNEQKLADMLVPVFSDTEQTVYRSVFRVPRAHVVVIEPDKIRKQRYYQFDTERELKLESDAEYEEAFRSVFEEAVRCRLRDAPGTSGIGTTLSGGLDSSSVACVAQRVLGGTGRVHTFSSVFPTVVAHDPRIDERVYIDAVLDSGKFSPNFVEGDQSRPVADLLELESDEPLPAPSLYMTKGLLEAARSMGLRVMLSGFDGDVAVSYGFERLLELARQMEWTQFSEEIASYAERRGVEDTGHYFRQFGIPVLNELAARRDFSGFAQSVSGIPSSVGYTRRRLWRRIGIPALFGRPGIGGDDNSPYGLNRTLNKHFVDRSGVTDRIISARRASRGSVDALREQHAHGLDDGRIEFATGVFDLVGSRIGVEQRYPFLDRRLLELCIAMPFDQRFRDGWARSILRRSMDGILPGPVQWRVGKADLSANVRLRLSDEAELVERTIGAAGSSLGDYITLDAIGTIISQLKRSPLELTESEVFGLFVAVSLAEWLETGQNETRSDIRS